MKVIFVTLIVALATPSYAAPKGQNNNYDLQAYAGRYQLIRSTYSNQDFGTNKTTQTEELFLFDTATGTLLICDRSNQYSKQAETLIVTTNRSCKPFEEKISLTESELDRAKKLVNQ